MKQFFVVTRYADYIKYTYHLGMDHNSKVRVFYFHVHTKCGHACRNNVCCCRRRNPCDVCTKRKSMKEITT